MFKGYVPINFLKSYENNNQANKKKTKSLRE